MKNAWKYALTFLAGALLCGLLVLHFTRGAGTDLNKQLIAANDTVESLRTSVADAISANHGLADTVSKLQGQLAKSSVVLARDDALIAAGQRVLNGIADNIRGAGGDIAKTIDAIADGFGALFNLYHANPNGPAKSPG